jgi:pyridoxal 5'-phosphate synthase pdxT subunit
MAVGVLALQGDFAAHAQALRRAGVDAREVRRVHDLESVSGLVLPGGESTTLLKLMEDDAWPEGIRRFHAGGGALFGTCAGAILLAREVQNPAQPSLGLLDVVVVRNSYGRQVDSFEARIDAPALGGALDAVFIRAPRLASLGGDVEVLARRNDEPVLVRQGSVLAATFHTELTPEASLHRFFTSLLPARRREAVSAT